MAKRLTTEDHLALLRRLRAGGSGQDTIVELRRLLADPRLHGIVVKTAAGLAEEIAARELADLLAACVQNLLGSDPKRDPGCEGKTAALKALVAWDAELPELYLEAAKFRQMAPTFGAPVDVAAEFRGLAALGLAASRPPGAIERLVDLLADPEKDTRTRAATALGMWPGSEAAPLLRLKARLGDPDAEVLAEVFASLLQQDGGNQLDFIAEFLGAERTVEAAALALGQSKLEAALPHLIAAWPAVRGSRAGTTLLLAISLHRSEKSLDWLLERLADAGGKEALAILDALALYRRDAKIAARIQRVAAQRADLRAAYREVFGGRGRGGGGE